MILSFSIPCLHVGYCVAACSVSRISGSRGDSRSEAGTRRAVTRQRCAAALLGNANPRRTEHVGRPGRLGARDLADGIGGMLERGDDSRRRERVASGWGDQDRRRGLERERGRASHAFDDAGHSHGRAHRQRADLAPEPAGPGPQADCRRAVPESRRAGPRSGHKGQPTERPQRTPRWPAARARRALGGRVPGWWPTSLLLPLPAARRSRPTTRSIAPLLGRTQGFTLGGVAAVGCAGCRSVLERAGS